MPTDQPESPGERRRFSRIAFDAPVTLSQGENSWQAHLVDLSFRGMLLEGLDYTGFDPASDLCARIELNETTTIAMQVAWRHSEGGRAGFECRTIDLDSIAALRRLVELNIGDPRLLQRELDALGH